MMLEKLYTKRFVFFFISQVIILFGSLLIPSGMLEDAILSFFFIVNVIAGSLLVLRNKAVLLIFIVLLGFLLFGAVLKLEQKIDAFDQVRMMVYFIFYGFVTIEIIRQVWKSRIINQNVILGLVSGYISLGLIGFFICLIVEFSNPKSFSGITDLSIHGDYVVQELMYFSYITLLTIGYGDIVPVTELARKASILIGLTGQMYIVVITAIVVGKFVNQFPTISDSPD